MGYSAFLLMMFFAAGPAGPPLQQTPTLQDVEQRLGPFTFAGQSVTVVLYSKRLLNPSDVRLSETLVALELRDTSGVVQYGRTFPYQVQEGKFQQTIAASAKLISGDGLAGLLLHYVRQPAPSGTGESWQIFRLRDGKLALLDVPLNPNPAAANGIFTGAILIGTNGAVSRIGPTDTVELRTWGGNFFLIVPLRVDWQQGRTMPGQQCFEAAGSPALKEVGCEMRIEAVRKPPNSEFTFVRLFNEAKEDFGLPRHVVLKRDSKVEYLAAKAIASWTANGDESSLRLTDIWLKVLIDDNEDNLGWIHTDEDFAAVGLPNGSSVP